MSKFSTIASRADLGLPAKWSQIMFWIFSTSSLVAPSPTLQNQKDLKFKEIPILPNYGGNGSESFWKQFPHNELPTKPETRVDHGKLMSILAEKSQFLLKSEKNRAERCIDYLCNGGPSFQMQKLGSCCVKNSKQATQHGAAVTDTIASWVEKKFVAGPFLNPPLPNFRANSILAVPQPNKVRICLNVSREPQLQRQHRHVRNGENKNVIGQTGRTHHPRSRKKLHDRQNRHS